MQIEPKTDFGILVGQVVFNLWIKTIKILFSSTPQELLGLFKF